MKKKLDGSTSEGALICNLVHSITATILQDLIELHPDWDETSIASYMATCANKFATMDGTTLVSVLPSIGRQAKTEA